MKNKTAQVKLGIYIDKDIMDNVEEKLYKEKITRSDYVRTLLRKDLGMADANK